jgi:hypothetical protein
MRHNQISQTIKLIVILEIDCALWVCLLAVTGELSHTRGPTAAELLLLKLIPERELAKR